MAEAPSPLILSDDIDIRSETLRKTSEEALKKYQANQNELTSKNLSEVIASLCINSQMDLMI